LIEEFLVDKKEIAYQMVMEKHQTVSDIAAALHISSSTIYRYIEACRAVSLS